MNENVIGKELVDAAVQVHRELGPWLLESVYEVVLAKELESRGLRIERMVIGPSEENLGDFVSLRERQTQVEPGGPANAASPHR